MSGIFAVLVVWVCFFGNLGAIGLVGPDEPRYAEVAKEMAATGDWVTPRLFGTPWFEKPILYYWTAAGIYHWAGANEESARLPSAIASTLLALGLATLALRFCGPGAAWVFLLIFPTSVGVFAFARAATPDMLFSAALGLAMGAATEVTFAPHPLARGRAHFALALFGALIGLAILAKGPAAIVLAAGSVLLWASVTGRWRDAWRLAHPTALLAAAIISLPWYVLCSIRNPEFLRTFILLHNFKRFLTPVFEHRQPFWFFGPILLLGLIPWTILLILPLMDILRASRAEWRGAVSTFWAAWAVFPVVFFSFSQSKLPGYILPSLAPLALIVGASIASHFSTTSRKVRQKLGWLVAGVGIVWVGLAWGADYWLKRLPVEAGLGAGGSLHGWVIAAAAAEGAVVLAGVAGRPKGGLTIAAILMTVLLGGVQLKILPVLDPYLSARAAAKTILEARDAAAHMAIFHLKRTWEFGLEFYLGHTLEEWTPKPAGPTWVATTPTGVEEMRRLGTHIQEVEQASPEIILVRLE